MGFGNAIARMTACSLLSIANVSLPLKVELVQDIGSVGKLTLFLASGAAELRFKPR